MQYLQYRKDIDALRGLSVLLVVSFHAFPGFMPGGFIGVDIFFVISGYLITSIIIDSIDKNDFSLLEFYKRRIRRLFPALLTVLITAMVVGWLVLFPDEYKQLADHVAYSAIYILNFLLIGEIGYFNAESVYKPLLHLWTLSVEEQYYVFWPLLLLVGMRQSYIKPVYIIILITLASFIGNIVFIGNYPENVYFHTLSRVWQLSSGSLLAILLFKKSAKEIKPLFFLGLGILIVAITSIDAETVYPGWYALLPTLGAIFIILGNVQFKQWGGMVSVGLISYPLYLWHWLVLSFLSIYLGRTPGSLLIIAAVALSFLLALLTYRYIEKLRYAKGSSVAAILFISLILVGLSGWYVKNKKGLPDRDHIDYIDKYNIEFTRTPAIDEKCNKYVNKKIGDERIFDYCRADNLGASKYIAVIGDSHAHVTYAGIANEANKRGYGSVLLANSSCPPLIDFIWGRNPKEINDCKIKINQILSILEFESKIDKVFITTRGPTYIHGEVDGKFTHESVSNSLLKVEQGNLTYKTYFDGFKKTISQLQGIEHIKDIFYFLENPELDFLPKEVIPRPFDRWGVSVQNNTMDKNLYLLRMKKYRDLVESSAMSYSKIKVIDPMPYLCDADDCITFKDNNFLYADDDHFSVYGSRYIANKIGKVVFHETQ